RHDVPVRMVRNGGGHEERGFGRDLADRHLVHDPVPVEIQGGGGGEVDMRDAGDTLDRLDPDVGEVGADDDPADVGDLTLRPVRERDVRAAGLHLRHEQLGGAGGWGGLLLAKAASSSAWSMRMISPLLLLGPNGSRKISGMTFPLSSGSMAGNADADPMGNGSRTRISWAGMNSVIWNVRGLK